MSEASRPKVYLCAPAELSAKSLAAFREDLGETGGFEIFPRPDLMNCLELRRADAVAQTAHAVEDL